MEDVLIVFGGLAFAAFFFGSIFRLIRAKIEGGGAIDDESFDRLAKAFIQHKKDTERRLQNLEAIIADEGSSGQSSSAGNRSLDKPHKTIEIDDKDEQKSGNEGSNLRNMLRE